MLLLLQLAAAASLASPVATRDSTALLHRLHADQRRLEWLHRQSLPWDGGAPDHPCDAHVGAYCYWVERASAPPPAENPRFVRQRAAFIARLDSAAAIFPADTWIAAALVRYRLDAGDPEGAVAAARDCADERGWCAALVGYALHARGRYAESARAFDSALAILPREVTCRWADLHDLVDGPIADAFEEASCEGRDSLAARVFWVATPLFLTGANDLRTEYFARRVRAWIGRDAYSAQFRSWDPAIEELWTRYGVPRWLGRTRPPPGSLAEPGVVAHDAAPGFALMPTTSGLDAPLSAGGEAWRDVTDRHARFRYAPAWLRALAPLRHTVARFRRGDSMLVVAAYDAAGDTAFHHRGRRRAGLFVGTAANDMRGAIDDDAPARGVLRLPAPAHSALLALEFLSPDDSAAARAREGISPLAGSISDLLLFDPRVDSAGHELTLDQVAAAMLASDTVAAGASVGVYWESYATDSAATSESSVELTPKRPSLLGRLLRRVHLAPKPRRVRIRWTGRRQDGVAGHSLVIRLDGLAPGAYRLTVRSGSATTARTLVLR